MLTNIIRALRLPFLSASVLPFVFGSLVKRNNFNVLGFFFGLVATMATHLSANLINDYADSRSGADWQDKKFYKFFGGSKLIQENVFSDKAYLAAAIFFAAISALSVILLAINLNSPLVIILYLVIIVLSWQYSAKPLEFSYHRLGEVFIFMLFGPVPVMGGYFIQTKIFPDLKSFLLSLPFAFLTTAILFSNEVPDFHEDLKAAKFNWVSLTGQKRAYLLYYLLMFLAFFSIIWNIALGYLGPIALVSLVFVFVTARAASILRIHAEDKIWLVESSKLTITIQTLVGAILILGVIL